MTVVEALKVLETLKSKESFAATESVFAENIIIFPQKMMI